MAGLSVSLEVVGWHVGGPDLRWASPWLLELLGGWFLGGDLLGFNLFFDFNFFLTLLNFLSGLLHNLSGVSLSLFDIQGLLSGSGIILNLLGGLLGSSLASLA